jgi:hypothetical protein
MLYGEHLADLEDLKAYILTGRHPKEDLRRAKQAMARTQSSESGRQSNSGSVLNA